MGSSLLSAAGDSSLLLPSFRSFRLFLLACLRLSACLPALLAPASCLSLPSLNLPAASCLSTVDTLLLAFLFVRSPTRSLSFSLSSCLFLSVCPRRCPEGGRATERGLSAHADPPQPPCPLVTAPSRPARSLLGAPCPHQQHGATLRAPPPQQRQPQCQHQPQLQLQPQPKQQQKQKQ